MISSILQWTLVLFGLLTLLRWYIRKNWKSVDKSNEINIRGKTVIVTGANTGIGKVAALEFADRGARVILACRDTNKAEQAVNWIRRKTSLGELVCMRLDLSSLQSVREFCQTFKSRYDQLDILVNNAGVLYPGDEKRKETEDGFEIHMGVNHLGHFLLTNLLLDVLKKSTPSRVVTVSSMIHSSGIIDFDDLMSEKREYKVSAFSFPLYSNSKLANALFNKELSRRLTGTGVTCYALCPGMVMTDMGRHMKSIAVLMTQLFIPITKYLMLKTPEEGASTIIHCALNKSLSNETGDMYQHCGHWEQESRPILKDSDAEKLWKISEKLVGLN